MTVHSEFAASLRAAANRDRFRLLPYFSAASAAAFVVVAAAVWYFESQQDAFFRDLQGRQNRFVTRSHEEFATRQEAAARRDLLAVQEAGNVNLTRLFANTLWESEFAPYVDRAGRLPVAHCRELPDIRDEADGRMKPGPAKTACFAEIGRIIQAFPEFAALDAKVHELMRKTTVFKIKVFDLRGITVYSSEHSQIGEDKSGNAGWHGAAVDGVARSELTFRDKFSAFEGVVENRDLISSYLPVHAPGSESIVGVFEVYSDVTPFLEHIRATTTGIRNASDEYRSGLEAVALEAEAKLEAAGSRTLTLLIVFLVILFAVLFAIVRRAASIMDTQESDRDRAQQQLAQSEKMASIGQMVAGIAHQLNTPLAFGQNNLQMAMRALEGYRLPLRVGNAVIRDVQAATADTIVLNTPPLKLLIGKEVTARVDVETPRAMLQDTLQGLEQMRELVDNLRDFTRVDRSTTARFDLRKSLHNVLYIAKSVMPTAILVIEDLGDVPEVSGNVSQLNQAFLNLVNNAAQAIEGAGTITVRTFLDGDRVRVDITDTGTGIPAEHLPHIWESYYTTKRSGEGTGLGLSIARAIITDHGGEIMVATQTGEHSGTTFSVYLPTAT